MPSLLPYIYERGDHRRKHCWQNHLRWIPAQQARTDRQVRLDHQFGGQPTIEDKRQILNKVRTLPLALVPLLDQWSTKALETMATVGDRDPNEQGYHLALWFRQATEQPKRVEPEQVIKSADVSIVDLALGESLDAIGCWGSKHGPAILVNINGRRSTTVHGRRATLAHELCHLLVDRKKALPFAEVLGGRSPYTPERRANAFAAEFLLPRSAAAAGYTQAGGILQLTLDTLCASFGVGRTLAAGQLLNGTAFDSMPISDQGILRLIVTGHPTVTI